MVIRKKHEEQHLFFYARVQTSPLRYIRPTGAGV